MSAIVNIFDSAFNDNHRTIKVDSGLRIEEIENLDWENTLIYVNGFECKKEYKLREDDVVTIRQFPSNQGSATRNVLQVVGNIFFPVTSAITYFVTGSDKGAILALGDTIDQAIHDALKQEPTDTKDIGQGEQLPTISGAKNRSGANQPIPLLLGTSMYTPITLAQSYTTVSGADGEEQTLHSLYCLGYKNVDVQAVKLGIYQLSADEKNGTSGTLNCTNMGKRSYDIDYHDTPMIGGFSRMRREAYAQPLGTNGYPPVRASRELDIDISAMLGNKYESCVIKSYDVDVHCFAYKVMKGVYKETNCTVSQSGNSTLHFTAEPVTFPQQSLDGRTINVPATAYLFRYVIRSCVVTVTTSLDTNHYPKEDTTRRKGYHQQLELQQTGSEVALYPQKVVQENFGTELMNYQGAEPLYMQPFSAKYPQKIQLEVNFQNLVHYADDGSEENITVDLCVGYSLDGGVTYLPFEPFTGSNGSITVSNEGTISNEYGTFRKTRFRGHKNKMMRFVAEKTFSFADVFNIPEGTVKCKNNVIEFMIWRNTVDYSVTDSKYQSKCCFSAIRTWCYDYKATLKQYEDDGIESLVIQKPIIDKYRNMTARLGFEIRAGEELKGTIDELNVLMQSRARYCIIEEVDGEKTYTWSGEGQQNPYALEYTIPTNNPASIALMLLQHEMLGEYAYTDAQIDLVSFGKFYEWCEQADEELINSDARKYTVNGVVSRQFKLIDLVNQILNCGHGRLVINGNKYGVVYDKPDLQPIMILNNQNVLDAKNTKNFLDDIDGYSCKFIDSLNDYQEDTQIFVPKDLTDPDSPTYKDPSEYKLESVELPWITDVKRAYRFCMYLLACRKLRPESWERKLGVDGSLVDIGSIVAVQDDTIVVGIGDGAQITEVTEDDGDIVSIDVDYGFEVTDTTKVYGVTIQHADPINGVHIRTYPLADFATTGTKKTLVFREPIDGASVIKPQENDIVSFGIYEGITTNAICIGKKSNNDGTYTLTLVPYQSDIYESEYGLIPEYDSNVTSPKDTGVEISEELPPVTLDQVGDVAQTVAEEVMEEGTDTPPSAPTDLTAVASKDLIALSCMYTGDTLSDSVEYFEFQITKGSGATPIVIKSGSNKYNYIFNRNVDHYPEGSVLSTWSVKVRAVNIYGLVSDEWEDIQAVTVDVTNYGTWIPVTPAFVSKVPNEGGIVFSWNQVTGSNNKELYGTQKYTVTVLYEDSDNSVALTTLGTLTTNTNYVTYNFNRVSNKDGYPEASATADYKGLNKYTFKIKVENESEAQQESTAIAFTNDEISQYGTWIPAYPVFKSAFAEQEGISINWDVALGSNGRKLYGGVSYKAYVIYNNNGVEVARQTLLTDGLDAFYNFNRLTDGYPEKQGVSGATITLNNYAIKLQATSTVTNRNSDISTGNSLDVSHYKTWKLPTISVGKEELDRTVILSALYGNDDSYGTKRLLVKIKRIGNQDTVETGGIQTYNDLLAVVPDSTYYKPTFHLPTAYSTSTNNEGNYRTNDTEPYEVVGNKVTHTLPLIGQTARIFEEGNVPIVSGAVTVTTVPQSPSTGDKILYNGTTSTLTKGKYYVYTGTEWNELLFYSADVPSVSVTPQSPKLGDVIRWTGSSDSTFSNNFYYQYNGSTWEQVFSKTLMVPTLYKYSIQMTNESGNVSNEVIEVQSVEATVRPTNISDIVHSHEHYKNLYVEKLSAINANIGMISQGGMGTFDQLLGNYWALSNLTEEETGIAGGVKQGSFRVGGSNEYFKVTPDPLIPDKYSIELKAGNIELTTDVAGDSAMDFQNGTYVYNDRKDSRLRLSPSGISAEKLVTTQVTPASGANPYANGWYVYTGSQWVKTTDVTVVSGTTYYEGNWQQMAKVIVDDKGNTILTNSDTLPPLGYRCENADIYHLEDSSHPEYAEGVTTNPQSLTFSGSVDDVGNYAPILDATSSSKCFNGIIEKNIASWTGRVAFFSKSDTIVCSSKGIKVNGSVVTMGTPLTGFNEAMRETSSIDSSKSVGAYLGLNSTQIQRGIYK